MDNCSNPLVRHWCRHWLLYCCLNSFLCLCIYCWLAVSLYLLACQIEQAEVFGRFFTVAPDKAGEKPGVGGGAGESAAEAGRTHGAAVAEVRRQPAEQAR